MADEKHRSVEEERKFAADAEKKRIDQAEEDRKKAEEEHKKRISTATALEPNAEGNVMVEAFMGPYRGQRLTMTAADGTAAIGAHWARNPVDFEYQHEALDEEGRKAAWEASNTWAQTQWDRAQKEEDEAPEGTPLRGTRRDMKPATKAEYATRDVSPKPAS